MRKWYREYCSRNPPTDPQLRTKYFQKNHPLRAIRNFKTEKWISMTLYRKSGRKILLNLPDEEVGCSVVSFSVAEIAAAGRISSKSLDTLRCWPATNG